MSSTWPAPGSQQKLRRQGVVPGDRVALLLSNQIGFPVAYNAVLRAGAIVVPTTPC
ncbi:AMP-binding protein [Micromonospora kangleipakensis]|uniref:AMP-binding protein n=1 Tax=Micromonospora kangleipakensis TaxID=1077942 RepID=UPI003BF8D8C8